VYIHIIHISFYRFFPVMDLEHQGISPVFSPPLSFDIKYYPSPIDEIAECPVCLEPLYDQYIVKLSCGHNLCRHCVRALEQSSQQMGCFLCPYCRQMQHRSHCRLVRHPLMFYYRFRHEIAVFVSLMCCFAGLSVILLIILSMK
jgi:hypothetical protein